MMVNNLRDMASDRLAGLRTLAHRMGEGATRFFCGLLILFAPAVVLLYSAMGLLPRGCLAAIVCLALALRMVHAMLARRGGANTLRQGPEAVAMLYLLLGLCVIAGEAAHYLPFA